MTDTAAPKDPNGVIAWRLERLESEVGALRGDVSDLQVRMAQLAPIEKLFYAAAGAIVTAIAGGVIVAAAIAP